MKYGLLGALLVFGIAAGCNIRDGINVNSRHTVEKVNIHWARELRLSEGLRNELDKMVGKKYDERAFSDLAVRIRRELHAARVSHALERGSKQGNVVVNLWITPGRGRSYPDRSKMIYLCQNQFSAAHAGRTNSVITTLRYRRQLEDRAGKSLRAATLALGRAARRLWRSSPGHMREECSSRFIGEDHSS